MIKKIQIKHFLLFVTIIFTAVSTNAQSVVTDTTESAATDTIKIVKKNNGEHFYDSLAYRANKSKVTSWLYDAFISSPGPIVDEREVALEYFRLFEGTLISGIRIKALDVFGPTITDTTRQASNWIERTANHIQTKSNLNTIQKQLLFKIGDAFDPELMAENERLLRQLPYLKDVRFLVEPDSLYPAFVHILVITKDRFSYGVTGELIGTESGDVEVYNKNIFGVGHELLVRFIGHVDKEPKFGVETYYRINNFGGYYINAELGYMNTYMREGVVLNIDKPFLSSEIKWGFGLHVSSLSRTVRISEDHPIELETPISESYNNVWVGHSFNLRRINGKFIQLTPTAGIIGMYFIDVPEIPPGSEHFFSNRVLYLAGLTLSQRSYVQDKLIYSYGIIEDIPAGFKHELLYGYDANEFGDRHFLQYFGASGMILPRKGYLYFSTVVNGYIKNKRMEEGMIRSDLNFFTRLRNTNNHQARSFVTLNYTNGIRRYPLEYLTLGKDNHIRGFRSILAQGQQRMSLKLEHVIFLPHEFYGFRTAVFGFTDLGIIGSNERFIFTENYYSGIGVGIRFHNENLVFDTFRMRLAFYPFHPKDMSLVDFILDEQSKTRFKTLEPTDPHPTLFK